jgi:hypothetical protein
MVGFFALFFSAMAAPILPDFAAGRCFPQPLQQHTTGAGRQEHAQLTVLRELCIFS